MVNGNPEYAGLGRRLVAHLVDVVLVFSIVILHAGTFRLLRTAGIWNPPIAEISSPEDVWRSFGAVQRVATLLAFVVASGLVFFPVFESSAWQATPGKRILNIFVVRDNRERVGLGRAVGRWLVKWFVGYFGGSAISAGMIGGLANHKAIHDFAAGTIVLMGRPAAEKPIEPWRFVAAIGIPFAWLIGTFYATL
jgi:uncharacterized RDD family membrane protein YckC